MTHTTSKNDRRRALDLHVLGEKTNDAVSKLGCVSGRSSRLNGTEALHAV